MKHFLSLTICLLLLLIPACSIASDDSIPVNRETGFTGQVVVIDPGHGGKDHGAVSMSGIKEDLLNLQVSLILSNKLEQHGAVVAMTRKSAELDYSGDKKTSKQRDMENRARFIVASNPDIVISIHMNGYPNRKYYGPQTYYLQKSAAGKKLAEDIQGQLLACLPSYKKFRIVEGDYFILHVVDSPTVLVECGFLSNPGDEKRLQDSGWQDKIAEGIFRGVCDYFGVQYD